MEFPWSRSPLSMSLGLGFRRQSTSLRAGVRMGHMIGTEAWRLAYLGGGKTAPTQRRSHHRMRLRRASLSVAVIPGVPRSCQPIRIDYLKRALEDERPFVASGLWTKHHNSLRAVASYPGNGQPALPETGGRLGKMDACLIPRSFDDGLAVALVGPSPHPQRSHRMPLPPSPRDRDKTRCFAPPPAISSYALRRPERLQLVRRPGDGRMTLCSVVCATRAS